MRHTYKHAGNVTMYYHSVFRFLRALLLVHLSSHVCTDAGSDAPARFKGINVEVCVTA